MRIHHGRLKAKGWTDQEITHAKKAVKRAEKKKHPAYGFLEVAVYWGLLFLTAVGIFLVSIVIVPVLFVYPDSLILGVLLALGLCLGSLFALLIKDVEWLEPRHHAFNLAVLALVAVLNILFITGQFSSLVGDEHRPWLLGLGFAVAILAPYTFHLLSAPRR